MAKVVLSNAAIRFTDYTLDVSRLALCPGVVLLRGSNGAGKSTLARACLGLLTLSSGVRDVLSTVSFGYMPQTYRDALVPFLSGLQNLHLYEKDVKARRNLTALAERFGIASSDLRKRPHRLSGGQCQKLVLIRELSLNADVVVLDEPFASLDISTRRMAAELIRDLAATKCSVLLISHGEVPDAIKSVLVAQYEIIRTSDNRACLEETH